MKSFRSEIEDPLVAQDIIDLEKKIYAYHNDAIDEEKFRSLRLARGVYGQRQKGVQMVRIKLPMGRFTANQLRRIAEVADLYGSGNLHITTRQDIQLHYVSLADTPELWALLEKDQITLREACGNTVRNVTASIWAGIHTKEAFDPTPYAQAFFEYFLRNPICQDMGRKFKVAFASTPSDGTFVAVHDLGFIPVLNKDQRGFRVFLGGGIGAQPHEALEVYSFLPVHQLLSFSESVIRVFERYGERKKRNKARLKFLIKELGISAFMELVNTSQKGWESSIPINDEPRPLNFYVKRIIPENPPKHQHYKDWVSTNTFDQKQSGFKAIGIPIATGDISSEKARQLADVIEIYTADDNRFTIGQSILLRDIKQEWLPNLYYALKNLNLHRIGFHCVNDIVACPGTETCNLGIANSMGLANALQSIIESNFKAFVQEHNLSIKISGCMNACGQHTIANIGFQGMTIKSGIHIAPATQILLGGGELPDGKIRFADKVLKVPSKRTPEVLKWLFNDFRKFRWADEDFIAYYDRKTTYYFYENLKHLSASDSLIEADFMDWGTQEKYEKAIGVGECAGVTVDLVKTLLFDAEESLNWAKEAFKNGSKKDAFYHTYNAAIRGAKAMLTSKQIETNSHHSIIREFDTHFKEYKFEFEMTFNEFISTYQTLAREEKKIKEFINQTESILSWMMKSNKTYAG